MSRPGTKGRIEKDAEDRPALYPFGTNLTKFLDVDEERTAPFEDRLKSSWRYLVGRVNRFFVSFRPRGSSVFDVEDVVNTVVERLVEKDHLWDPSRGRYSTFVDAVMRSVLVTYHEKTGAVSGPANSFSRLKDYREREAVGSLTLEMRATMVRIEKAMGDFESIDERYAEPNGHDDDVIERFRDAFKAFDDPMQVWVVVRRYGLLGMGRMTLVEMASRLGISKDFASRLDKDARRKLEEILKSCKEDTDGETLRDPNPVPRMARQG